MKKIGALIVVLLLVSSCKLTDQNEDQKTQKKLANTAKDSTVVNDKDENGCLASAGYVWSKVNKECVKGLPSAIRVKTIEVVSFGRKTSALSPSSLNIT